VLAGVTLSNAGTIRSGGDAGVSYATGVWVDGNVAGTLSNSGSIGARANTSTSSANARGVYVGTDLSGSFTNSGSISATATGNASSSSVQAYGVNVVGSLSGTLTNSGSISATAINNSSSDASAYGIYVGAISAGGVLSNSGSISATANNLGGGDATAYGISVENDLAGSLANSGSIRATATGTDAYANGVDVGGSIAAGGSLSNSGSIPATAHATDNASAFGVAVDTLSGTFTNSGRITATATAQASGTSAGAWAAGIYLWDLASTGTLSNSGSISATAMASGADAWAWAGGVDVGALDTFAGTLSNSGRISASATAVGSATAHAQAAGLWANHMSNTGLLTNSGTITATATATGPDASAEAYGVWVWQMDGTLNNSGSISASASAPGGTANAYSLYVNDGTGTINNLGGGVLSGNLLVGGTVAVNNAGTIALPAGAAGSIAGNYTQQAGGVLEIGAASNASYATLAVIGTANLSGSNTIAVHATPGNTLAVGNVLQDVLGAGAWAGLASGAAVNVVGTPLFTYAGVEDGTGHIDVSITGKNSFSGLLGGMAGLGGALDGLNSTAELDAAAQNLLPLLSGGLNQVTGDVLHAVTRIIQARQEANRSLSSGDEFYGDRHVWFKPFGSRAEQDNHNGVAGYDADT